MAVIRAAPHEGNDHDSFAMNMKSKEQFVGRNCLAKAWHFLRRGGQDTWEVIGR